MYLLDTNVVSLFDPKRRSYTPDLVAWLVRNSSGLFLSVITIIELDAGLLKLRREKQHGRAAQVDKVVTAIMRNFQDRVLQFDIPVAKHLAGLIELTHRQTVALPDLIIAATSLSSGLTLLTHNTRDFARLKIPMIDPFVQLPPDV